VSKLWKGGSKRKIFMGLGGALVAGVVGFEAADLVSGMGDSSDYDGGSGGGDYSGGNDYSTSDYANNDYSSNDYSGGSTDYSGGGGDYSGGGGGYYGGDSLAE
jgi:hypothetical protein